MKIRTSLALQYTCVTAILFLLFAASVFYLSERSRSNAFFRALKSEAITKAHLFLNNQVDAETMQSTYLNNKQFIDEVEVAVYTPDFDILYHDALSNDIVKEDKAMIHDILNNREVNMYIDGYQGVGLVYTFNDADYVVTAAAYDGYGYANRNLLWEWLAVFIIIALLIVVAVGYFFARNALRPIRIITEEAEEINANQINKRLPIKNEKDELGELCLAFNALLDRLDKSFKSQKMFVSNVSHELRTPLAALITQLDISLLKERTADEYRLAISNALYDADRIVKLINGLLDLAKSDFDHEQVKMVYIRLDELLLDAIDLTLKAHPEYHIELIFDQEADDDSVLTISANKYLLTIALINLIENNCKYSSNHTSLIQISFWEDYTIVRFSDTGMGMSEKDKEKLFDLFYRGENRGDVAGHGIGMTLTQKIITLHKGEISVHSKINEGTTFLVRLPHI